MMWDDIMPTCWNEVRWAALGYYWSPDNMSEEGSFTSGDPGSLSQDDTDGWSGDPWDFIMLLRTVCN